MATQGRRRAYGQHFLRDKRVCEEIAQEAIAETLALGCRALLEIGPGKGAITDPILARLSEYPEISFTLCEKDRGLADEWRTKLSQSSGVAIEDSDFLSLPEDRWLGRTPLAVVSNLPYSAGTAILNRLALHPTRIPVMVLMFQAEVAQRLRAQPGTKSWGSLSVWIQNQWDVTRLLSVPPGAFSPPPEVDSEVIVLKARAVPRVDVFLHPHGPRTWETLLRVCFAHRRKMLRSGMPRDAYWQNTLERSGVDGTKRAEALSWEEWVRLFEAAVASEA